MTTITSIVDGKTKTFHAKYGRETGQFLLEYLATYEASLFDEGNVIVSFLFVEIDRQELIHHMYESIRDSRVLDFMEDNSNYVIERTIVKHPKSMRSFHFITANF